ncbi:MAG: hypothetical protein M1281_02285 [Chloroflexi bacterium]|nr:hypothetical protein [Chloroflexota bacterium]
MARRIQILLILSLGFAVALSLAWFGSASTASAQCGTTPSTCKTCHETQKQAPVSTLGVWHSDHASFDYCALCHGGDKIAVDASAAHNGVTVKLNDMQAACTTCHTGDAQMRLQGYAAALGVSLENGPPSAAPTRSGVGAFLGVNSSGVSEPTPTPVALAAPADPGPNVLGNTILVLIIAAVLIGGGGYIYWNERRNRRMGEQADNASVEALPVDLKGYPKEVAELAPGLARLSPEGLKALRELLEDPAQAEELFLSLAELDIDLLKRVHALSRSERLLLTILADDEELEIKHE